MASDKKIYLGVDVGQRRIGLAHGDSIARLAATLPTIEVDGQEDVFLQRLVADFGVTDLVVGRPRNQAGELTNQTESVEQFVARVLQPMGLPIHWQDESVTSIEAEERLAASKKPYTKADIDAEAAAIILQDYLETL